MTTNEDREGVAAVNDEQNVSDHAETQQAALSQRPVEVQEQTDRLPAHAYTSDLIALCELKVSDFHLLGYQEVTAKTVWDCVNSRIKGEVSLHEMVAAILSLQIGTLMNYLTISAYKGEFHEEDV